LLRSGIFQVHAHQQQQARTHSRRKLYLRKLKPKGGAHTERRFLHKKTGPRVGPEKRCSAYKC